MWLALAFLFFLLVPRECLAAVTIDSFPNQIEIGQEFSVHVSLSGLTSSVHYLSVALQKASGDPYFGQTKKGADWVEADDANCLGFPDVNKDYSGDLIARVVYDGKDFPNQSGDYFLKVVKYTASCSKSSSEEKLVGLIIPTPAATATPVLPSLTPSPQPVTSTAVPVATATFTPTVTPTPSVAVCQINQVKSENGEELSSVRVLVDGVYVHHYAPETLTFCESCFCSDGVVCDPGSHQIILEKSGYQNWERGIDLALGDRAMFDPIMLVKPTVTTTPTPSSTPTPLPIVTVVKPSSSPRPPSPIEKEEDETLVFSTSSSGRILGEVDKESSSSEELPKESSRSTYLLPLFLVIVGSGLLIVVFVGPRLREFFDTIKTDEE